MQAFSNPRRTMREKYQVGNSYYRLTFPDRAMLYPNIQAFVFIGMNLSKDDHGDVWYFQFNENYVTPPPKKINAARLTVRLTESDLSEMMSAKTLSERLFSIEKSRKAQLAQHTTNPRR